MFYYGRSISSRYCGLFWSFHFIQNWVSISNVTLPMLFQMIFYFFNSDLWFVFILWLLLVWHFYILAFIMASESADFKIEQRAYVKIRTLLQVSPTDIHKDLMEVYNDRTLPYSRIVDWTRRFR